MIVRTRPKRFLGFFRGTHPIQRRWATERCPDPRFNGRHLEVMFQSWGTPYCVCPSCDAAFPGYSNPWNLCHPLDEDWDS